MDRLFNTILVGVISFTATNLDDILVLMIFFSRVSPTFLRRHIVLGQYLGFTTLLLISVPGYFGGLVLPESWIGFLGFLPIWIGISSLSNRDSDLGVQTVSNDMDFGHKASKQSFLKGLLSPQAYQVAAITVANGGDNVGIYIPLFSSSRFPKLAVLIGIFLLLVGVWCWIAEYLTRQRSIANLLTRYAHQAIPFVLIGIGLYILIDSGTLDLLMSLLSSFSS
jgi:cadmium resistance transport/sequestration family protein